MTNTRSAAVVVSLGLAAGLVLLSAACAPMRSRASIEKLPVACQTLSGSIYFERDSAAITPEAAAVISGAADLAKGCAVTAVRVIGLADAVGAPGANQLLSEERARNTTAYLASHGFTGPKFEVAASGDAGSLTPSGQAQPLRRRADVVIELAPLPR